MLWFSALVGAYWFGFTPANLPPEAIKGLLDIVYIGIGGYVIGRSAEEVAKTSVPVIAQAVANKKRSNFND